ncbi:hypothetical protein NLI96_g7035 [Meripilus lineatus]|uniref:F-box domain-containing protein n=1 Tax=Meripilus lineatus TaxID=2056292 RepID=A0AAD5V4N1_9APHY|nr:hypothetical protein NLI96_g7035 [Physisporinus lineatus]
MRSISPQVDHAIQEIQYAQGGKSMLEDLTLDMVIEVLSYLSINDLWHLSRTSAILREFLTRPGLEPHWERALEDSEDAPPKRPEGLNVGSFIDLMFGNRCQNCCKAPSDDDPLITMYHLHRRYCKTCYLAKTITYSEESPTWILPETFRLAPFHSKPRRFFIEDLAKFQEEYLKEVDIVYENWHNESNQRRRDILRAHLWPPQNLEFGYEDESSDVRPSNDIKTILEATVKREMYEIGGRAETFSDFFIDSVKRKVHEQINAFNTAKRVKKEIFKRIVDDRKRLAREAFMDATVKATWLGRLLLRLMTSDFVEYLPNVWPINNIISQNKTVNVLKDDFQEPMKQWEANLLGFVCARSIAVRELTKRVWKAVGEWKLAPWIGEAEVLRGAFTSTLSCRECARSEGRPRILMGMEEILFHRHDPECLSYDKYAALNLQSLVDARQGHPLTLKELRRRLDTTDGRFVCLKCPQQCADGVLTVSAMSWRQCVEHVCIRNQRLLPHLWRTLGSDEERKVKEIEASRQQEDDDGVYQCALCLPSANQEDPIPEPRKISDVFRHLNEIHKLSADVFRLGENYIVDPRFSERGTLPPVTLTLCESDSNGWKSGYRLQE